MKNSRSLYLLSNAVEARRSCVSNLKTICQAFETFACAGYRAPHRCIAQTLSFRLTNCTICPFLASSCNGSWHSFQVASSYATLSPSRSFLDLSCRIVELSELFSTDFLLQVGKSTSIDLISIKKWTVSHCGSSPLACFVKQLLQDLSY